MDKIEGMIKEFASFGATSDGGITRLLYSESWRAFHTFLQKEMAQMGLDVSIDSVGNVFGRVSGKEKQIILTGSHIDTVVNGGKLDGQFGVIAAMIAVQELLEEYGQPQKILEVVAFAEEEGSRFAEPLWGSKNVTGVASKEAMVEMVDIEGNRFVDEMKVSGFDFEALVVEAKKDVGAFIELHIEQGLTLEKENKKIGVVETIVGQKGYTVSLVGSANHAGTTAMRFRQDAMVSFAEIIQTLTEYAIQVNPDLVITFGQVVAIPNTPNVIVGNIRFTIDVRHYDQELLDRFCLDIENKMMQIARKHQVKAEIKLQSDEHVSRMDESLVKLIEETAVNEEISYMRMHSGAGHDSQVLSTFCPTGMIFVPSIAGLSHHPSEATNLEDLVTGINVLKKVLYELAY